MVIFYCANQFVSAVVYYWLCVSVCASNLVKCQCSVSAVFLCARVSVTRQPEGRLAARPAQKAVRAESAPLPLLNNLL